jgi:hypothetical protein
MNVSHAKQGLFKVQYPAAVLLESFLLELSVEENFTFACPLIVSDNFICSNFPCSSLCTALIGLGLTARKHFVTAKLDTWRPHFVDHLFSYCLGLQAHFGLDMLR